MRLLSQLLHKMSEHDSNVLVTGGCGFIGSNYISHLLEVTKAKIVNYDSLAPGSNKEHVETSDRCVLVVGDVRNSELLDKTLRLHNVEEVVHFAALAHAGDSFERPEAYIEANVQGTLCLLEAVRKYGRIKRFLYVSTDEVYGESDVDDSVPKKETASLKPTNPYAVSKLCAERLVDVYHRAHAIPACFVRMCNVYGPRQSYDKVFPKFIKQAYEDRPFTIEGNGQQLRTWLYVTDACRAIDCVLQGGKLGEVYNVGTPLEVSVLDLAKAIKDEVNIDCGKSLDRCFLPSSCWSHHACTCLQGRKEGKKGGGQHA